jgi:protein-disulfide isomerase
VLLGGWALTGLLTLSMMAAGAGVWFIGTQAIVVEHFCLYCLVVHACGLAICTLSVLLLRDSMTGSNHSHMHGYFGGEQTYVDEEAQVSVYQPLIAAGVAGLGLMALIGGQLFFSPDTMEVIDIPFEVVQTSAETTANEEPSQEDIASTGDEEAADAEIEVAEEDEAPPEKLEIISGGEATATAPGSDAAPRYFTFKYLAREVDAAGNPVVGNPYAPHRCVEMMDYTCPHCSKLHPHIKAAVERYGDQLGFVIYHVPLSRKCNPLVKLDQSSHQNACEYAKLAYGVWKLAPDRFAEFHEWLLEGKRAPAIHEAKKKAREMAGDAIFFDKTIATESSRRIGEAAKEFERLQIGLPILIFENGIIRGMPDTDEKWFEILEEKIGVTAPDAATN